MNPPKAETPPESESSGAGVIGDDFVFDEAAFEEK